MSAEASALDPDLLELLHAIPARGSALESVTAERLARGLRDGSAALHGIRAGASSAERELLSVHREELAYRLALAGQRGLLESSPLPWALQRRMGTTSVEAMQVPEPEITNKNELEIEPCLGAVGLLGERERVLSVVQDLSPRFEEALFALSICVRIVPSSRYRIWWAIALLHAGRFSPGCAILENASTSGSMPLTDSYCLFNLGFPHWQESNYEEAAARYRDAYSLNPDLIGSCAYALWLSVMADQYEQAHNLGKALEERSEDLEESDFGAALDLLRERVQWTKPQVDRNVARLAVELSERNPEGSGRVLESLRPH